MALYRLPIIAPTVESNDVYYHALNPYASLDECIGEWPTHDGAMSYVECPQDGYHGTTNVAFSVDYWQLPRYPITSLTVTVLANGNHNSNRLQLWARHDSTGGLSPQIALPYTGEDWWPYSYTWAEVPATGTNHYSWNDYWLSRSSFGFWMWNTAAGNFPRVRITQLYVMADIAVPASQPGSAVPLLF